MHTILSRLSTYWFGVKKYALRKPVTTAIIAIAIIFGGYYAYGYFFSTTTQTTYSLGTVEKSTIVATVSGSGQVSTSNKIDIKPKVSGEVVWVAVKAGDVVAQGQALASIDNTDAKKAVTNAEQSLITSKLQYQKDSAQAPIDYQTSLNNLATAQDDLASTYEDIYSDLSSTYLDLPTAAAGMNSILYGYDVGSNKSVWNVSALPNLFSNQADNDTVTTFADHAKADYASARAKYDASIVAYKQLSRASGNDALEARLTDTITTATGMAQALQSEVNLLGETIDLAQQHSVTIPTAVTTLQNSARTYLSTVNSDLSTLLNARKSLTTAKQAIVNSQNAIALAKVGNTDGTNPISLQISANNIASQESNLAQLRQTLADYTIVAPFDGIISAVNAVRGDSAPSVAATIITKQKIAELTLNEVDAAKVSIGDRATLTFDAIDSLTLTGKVSEIDTVGTVSQGVVSYAVKIAFDSQDDRIKSGMTVNASIQTDIKQDVLVVPSSAVKSLNGTHYVLTFNPTLTTSETTGVTSTQTPVQVPVEVGISDDINVEIISGLVEGQQIITRSSSATQTTTTTTRSGLGGGGIRL